jgi:formate hydrogenlyase subunit 4
VTSAALIAVSAQVVVVVAGAPLLVGLMRQARARLEGRAGAGIGQPWRDIRKLVRRAPAAPTGTGWAFRLAPLLLMGTSLVLAAVVPLLTTASPLDRAADLFAVVGLLALGTVTLALAALDTGTAFGGMGASREMTILALVEPTILVAVFALSARVGSTNLAEIVTTTLHDPLRVASPASLLAAAALVIVVIAETGRLPVDNPATHLELTMIHEAMVLEYAGSDLALVELAASMRLTVHQLVPTMGHRRCRPRSAAARAGGIRRQGGGAGTRTGRGRGVHRQAAAVPGARTARRLVRAGRTRRRLLLLHRMSMSSLT